VLTETHRDKVLDSFISREDGDYFSRLVDHAEIAENDYNLSISTYVAQEDTREVVDIAVLNADVARIVARQSELRTQVDAIVADLEGDKS
jgi:type I restriction enzyme M protein